VTAYAKLEDRFRRYLVLGQAEGVLHWDMSTVMPSGGSEARAEQLAVLKTTRHALLTGPETVDLLESAAEVELDVWQRANLAEMECQWRRATALDEDLVEALSRAESACEMAWRAARPAGDFAAVLPDLNVLVALVRETAAAKADALGLDPYDALLDAYEPGGRQADIDPLFEDLEAFLPEFLGRVLENQARQPAPVLPPGPFPIAGQRALAHEMMAALGFDFDHGRLDESRHPFCGGVPEDVRITTRYDKNDFTSSLMAVLHETGHALYERGLPPAWRHQPVGLARSMSIHESQSLLIEMQVCRSRPFLAFAAPLIGRAFGGAGEAWDEDNLYRLLTRVEPGLIRVDADEVTYPAHVIVRYRLEKAIIGGTMEAADIPAAWNEGMNRLLGITPPGDGDGCLQDIHWYDGAWGYFPTYTLGAIAAAQIFAAAKSADGAITPGIAKGDFKPLLAWLGDAIHAKGSVLPVPELLTQATGRPLDAGVFKTHLEDRYLA
jgi:carboxypeptidase Taq